ncbi:hypothetical protein CFP56_001398, partial [Quercus suber]
RRFLNMKTEFPVFIVWVGLYSREKSMLVEFIKKIIKCTKSPGRIGLNKLRRNQHGRKSTSNMRTNRMALMCSVDNIS